MTPDSFAPLVVGAGPVGLTMANELARHGVSCRIIDRATEPSQTSRALAIFPRTLEAFESMGIADRFLAAGHRLHGLSLHHRLEQIDFRIGNVERHVWGNETLAMPCEPDAFS